MTTFLILIPFLCKKYTVNTYVKITKFFSINCQYFLTHQFWIMLCVLKRTVSLRGFFLSTHNICFGWEIWKLLFNYALLTRALVNSTIVVTGESWVKIWHLWTVIEGSWVWIPVGPYSFIVYSLPTFDWIRAVVSYWWKYAYTKWASLRENLSSGFPKSEFHTSLLIYRD